MNLIDTRVLDTILSLLGRSLTTQPVQQTQQNQQIQTSQPGYNHQTQANQPDTASNYTNKAMMQTDYQSAYQAPKNQPYEPKDSYTDQKMKDSPVQTSAMDVKPGLMAYNTGTVFIPPPIGGGKQNNGNCPEPAPCPACARCPEPSFDCKKVPNYASTNSEYLPMPVLSDFSQFGM
jgi:DNA mismatch repair ATPase MutL